MNPKFFPRKVGDTCHFWNGHLESTKIRITLLVITQNVFDEISDGVSLIQWI